MSFKECYALEKIHGTSAHIAFKDGKIRFFAGGGKHDSFVGLFDVKHLEETFNKIVDCDIIIFGESYGGKQQGMSATYGTDPKFVVFDVKIGDVWLDVPKAEELVKAFGLEFVDYHKIATDLETLNKERDLPSTQAIRNGVVGDKLREGVVLRPLIELRKNNGKRIVVKHKRDEFMETKTKREVDPEKLRVLKEAKEIAEEWVTPMRMDHVLDKIGSPTEISETGKVIKAMIEDVYEEAVGEIVESRTAQQAIGKATALLYKKRISKI